jgi:hypothetical protein
MANARQQKLPKALIRRTLESARREIEQIERKFHRTISRLLKNSFTFGDEAGVIAVVDEDVPDEPPGGA